MIIFPSTDSHKYSIYFTETFVRFGAKYKWKLSKDRNTGSHIHTPQEGEESRSDDDKDIDTAEDSDK